MNTDKHRYEDMRLVYLCSSVFISGGILSARETGKQSLLRKEYARCVPARFGDMR